MVRKGSRVQIPIVAPSEIIFFKNYQEAKVADWDILKTRGNVDDRRTYASGGGLLSSGLLVILLTLGLNYLSLSVSPGTVSQVINTFNSTQVSKQEQPAEFKGDDSYEVFASKILGSTDDTWSEIFASNKSTYAKPKLVLYRNSSHTGCGIGSSAYGPFYCPNDSTIYLDETFFDDLRAKFGGSSGEVAQAYVIAHEVGHHVQNIQGDLSGLGRSSQRQAIETELQADCYAGVWAYSINKDGVLAPGDIEQALSAASAVGDDNIQSRMGGSVNPETWTHGSSEQRMSAFNKGFETGNPAQCSGLSS